VQNAKARATSLAIFAALVRANTMVTNAALVVWRHVEFMTVALAHVVVVRKAIARDAWISTFALVNLVGLSTALKGIVIAMTNVSSSAPYAKR
jgi:hypothetical protein